MDPEPHRLTIPADAAGRRLDQVLAELLPDLSRSQLKQWILDGRVHLDGEQPVPRTRVAAGQEIAVEGYSSEDGDSAQSSEFDPDVVPEAVEMPLTIAYEDEYLLVINKPAGLVVHPGAGNHTGTLQNGLLAYAPELADVPRSGILHRLDKDTSGLLIVARTLEAHTILAEALEARDIQREYRAVCVGPLTAGGVVDAAIARHQSQRTKMAVTDFGGREAVTHYRVLGRFSHHTYIAVRLDTGRTHQIRVHMAHIRHPIVGDPAYSGRLIVPAGATPVLANALRGFRRQALHAHRLQFLHPVDGHTIELKASLPDDFRVLLAALVANTNEAAIDAAASVAEVARLEALPWPEPLTDPWSESSPESRPARRPARRSARSSSVDED
ncbi:MAG: 23S rRNA pseudouridine(1911/1915/1917) synthase RluD [Gammaproteobacteria bacterium]